MKKIYLLLDYRDTFGSKYGAIPYRSGMDKELLKTYFNEKGYNIEYLSFSDIDFRVMNFNNQYVLYTSSEDKNYKYNHYKSYIEDICYALQLHGAILIPEYKYLRAHSNKVFMELLRDLSNLQSIKNIKSYHFGSLEEFKKKEQMFESKQVIKGAEGSMSQSVSLANNQNQLMKQSRKISRSKDIFNELWDRGRSFKHKGYIRDSKYRKKFIIQNFIEGLSNDWKILVFGKKYYISCRETRKNDFRASGSGKVIFREDIPEGILDFAKNAYHCFNVPNISIDVAFDGKEFYLIEFQALYFGSQVVEHSPFYFTKENSRWIIHKGKSILEKEYVNSIDLYIRNRRNN